MVSYLLLFGRSPKLSLAEVQSFFPNTNLVLLGNYGVQLMLGEDVSPQFLATILGGTVKVAVHGEHVDEIEPTYLASRVTSQKDVGKITFGISLYGAHGLSSGALLRATKNVLEEQGKSVRFIEATDGEALGSVVIEKQQVCDIVIVAHDHGYFVAQTGAVQPFGEWSKRDYDRPYADAKSGMLPPKVARMIVNIALGGQGKGKTLLDPFCGMGTVLGEALLCGAQVMGSDVSQQVVAKAEKNLMWLKSVYPSLSTAQMSLATSDATHVSETIAPLSIDAIVTEPFMGSTRIGEETPAHTQNVKRDEVKNTVKGLEKLYIGCLKDWHKILKPGGVIVMALPKFVIGTQEYFVKKLIDSCEKLGYTMTLGPIEYSRPQATVRREFYKFVKSV